MIGDSTHDLDCGRAAGMTTVAVLTGLADRDDLAPHADVVLPDIGSLPGWLGLPETGPGEKRRRTVGNERAAPAARGSTRADGGDGR
jgi:hypothetical protein